jgi:hypothetical protein
MSEKDMLDFILKFLALGASDKVSDEFSKARDDAYSIKGFLKVAILFLIFCLLCKFIYF